MFSTVLSGALYGTEGYLVRVEADVSPGLPCFTMVGSLSGEVKESGERVRIALKNIGIKLPPSRICVNLSPADRRKDGTAFDLPIAVAVLAAAGLLDKDKLDGLLLLGELGLNGEVKPARGVLPIANAAGREGVAYCLVPEDNAEEGALVEKSRVIGIDHLSGVIAFLNASEGERRAISEQTGARAAAGKAVLTDRQAGKEDFGEIAGQENLKRAAVIAAAGFHNLLLLGPPGTGKTMIARRIPTILPPLDQEEWLEVASLYSIAGCWQQELKGKQRPFKSPHHTVSAAALTGGGRIPRPGVISLSHRGVLFLDELPEFKRQTLDALRQPLEEGRVQVSRCHGTFTYPADFMLVAAMNPCPCGFYPDRNRCRCSPSKIHGYLAGVSGPILDRMDLCVHAPAVEFSCLKSEHSRMNSAVMAQQVKGARERQQERFAGTSLRFNSEMKAGDIRQYCRLAPPEWNWLEQVFNKFQLSARAYQRLMKVARTIADVENCEEIQREHLSEAICYYTAGREVFHV